MHEMSLALNIVEQAREAASREGAARVLEVEIEVGSLAGVMIDALKFCLESITRSDELAGTVFKIQESKAKASCRSCLESFEADNFFPRCLSCGSDKVNISGGQELKIRSLIIEE